MKESVLYRYDFVKQVTAACVETMYSHGSTIKSKSAVQQ